MISPIVSVIIPAYNRAATIGRSIDSVLAQGYRPIELIVVDDGSTDQTVEVVRRYGAQVTLICQPNGGPSSARNNGVANSKGEFIAFLDSDDTWEPAKLQLQMQLMVLGGSRVPCCVCNALTMVDDVRIGTSFGLAEVDCDLATGYWLNPAELVSTRFILFNQVVVIRRDTFEKIGGFKEHMRLLEDHDLAFRLSLMGPWGFVSELLVTKYEQQDSVGGQAQRDPRAHVGAWVRALRGFLDEPISGRDDIQRNIVRSLRDGVVESYAVDLMLHGNALNRSFGFVLKFLLRMRAAVRRRLPSWPQVEAVAMFVP